MEAIQWAVGLLVTVNIAVTGFLATRLWAHHTECKGVSEDVAQLKSDVERMKSDIGTHDTGLRGAVHRTSQMSTAHEMRIAVLEREKR